MSKWPKAFHKHLRETQENEVVGVGDAVCMKGERVGGNQAAAVEKPHYTAI